MSHSAFVLLSYGAAGLVVAVLLGWLFWDRAATLRELDRLEAAGLKRRSETAPEGEEP